MRFHTLSCVVLSLVLLATTVSSAQAFDNQRKGFVLGFSAGPSVLWNPDAYGATQEVLLQTDFKIGYGFSERFLLYYSGKQLWGFEGFGTIYGVVLPGIGISYYLSPGAKSVFLTAGAGPTLGYVNVVNDGFYAGGSVFAGVGYEFARHWSLELDLIATPVTYYQEFIGSVGLTVGVLGY